ncbi:MAG: hypothetical protein NC918_02705 [Candidatus Omnitrophica bacterium]|nr:hypothetical protein [Candidatus Omnitrophota bacterium]
MAEGGFSLFPEASLRGAEIGINAKAQERLSELKLLLDKIDSVANWGYLSPYAGEFYPEVKNMSQEQKLKVIQDTLQNLPQYNIQDIVRQGGYKLLELAYGINQNQMSLLGRMTGEKIEPPDWMQRYNAMYDNTKRGIDKQEREALGEDEINTITNYQVFNDTKALPGVDKIIATYGDKFANLLKNKKFVDILRKYQYNPNADYNFIKAEERIRQAFYNGQIDKNQYMDAMANIYATKQFINNALSLKKNIFERKVGGLGIFGKPVLTQTQSDPVDAINFLRAIIGDENLKKELQNESNIGQKLKDIGESSSKLSENIQRSAVDESKSFIKYFFFNKRNIPGQPKTNYTPGFFDIQPQSNAPAQPQTTIYPQAFFDRQPTELDIYNMALKNIKGGK